MKNADAVRVPILTYHSIDDSGSVISIAPIVFRRQMKWLSENNFRVISLSELADCLNQSDVFGQKTVALTFDDGFQNFYNEAFPILAEYDFTATVFIVTDFCGKNNEWEINSPKIPRARLLSWSEIKELSAAKIEFGAHTRTHPDLTGISAADAAREIRASKCDIENALGCAATTFAYPYGKFNLTVKQIVETTFESAYSTNLGKVQKNSDFFLLERIDAYYLTNQRIFNFLAAQNFDQYLRLRQSLRDFKSFITRN